MQIRSCATWLSIVGLIAIASPASAAPKHKKAKASAAAESEPEPASPAKDKGSVDDLMEKSTKKKATVQASSGEPAPVEPAEAVGEPDAWEKPPAEEEKPKHVKLVAPEAKKGDGRNIDIALDVGWGFQTSKFFSVDPYQLGFGLRGAYELESHLVIGVGFQYFIGSTNVSTNGIGGVALGQISTKANYMLAHAEFGYNLWYGDVILRPSIWAGAAIGTQNPPMSSGTSGVITSFLLAPGLTLQYILGSTGWFLGADGRINLIIGSGNSGLLLTALLGKRF